MTKALKFRMIRQFWFLFVLATMLCGAGTVIWLGRVSVAPNALDREMSEQIFGDRPKAKNFDEEIAAIRMVQRYVLAIAPVDKGIPHGKPREAADIRRLGFGLCYDRSRAMAMLLRARGYKVRHASLYPVKGSSPIDELLTQGVPSHAVASVLTSRGWLMVGSNTDWIALTASGQPITAPRLLSVAQEDWAEPVPDNGIFSRPLVVIYGLYSRHGRFYAPYVPVPDFNFPHLIEHWGDSQILVSETR